MKQYRPLLVILILIALVFLVTSETIVRTFFPTRTTTLPVYVKSTNTRIIKPPTKEQAAAINKTKPKN